MENGVGSSPPRSAQHRAKRSASAQGPLTWAMGAASAAGAPAGFSLLPGAPLQASPHWAAAAPPSAASILLATDAVGAKATSSLASSQLFAMGHKHLW